MLAKWTPTGTETAPVLSPILKPLEALKSKLLLIGGMDIVSAVGEQHQAGIIALLTGTSQATTGGKYSLGPSLDQVLASKLSAGKKKSSIQAAIRWATGKSHGLLSPINSLNFETAAPYRPIPPRLDPQEIWKDPPSHGKKSMPFMLAGNGGGLRTGRFVQYKGVSHNNLLVAILNLFGDTRTTFGEAKYCTGAVTGLV